MKQEITALRQVMQERGIHGYIVPTTDFHGSEYVNPYFQCRKYLTNFTGSNGTLLVTQEEALLWTDSRYFIQAPKQLSGTGITMMKCQTPGVPELDEYIAKIGHKDFVLGFDGRVVSLRDGENYAKACKVVYEEDLVDLIWDDRPQIKASKVYRLPESLTGEPHTSKAARVQQALSERGIDYHLMTSLEDIAWLFNLRGDDIPYTPVFFAFALISPQWIRLYMLDETFEGIEGAETRPYLQIFEDLKALPQGKILLNPRGTSYALMKAIPEEVEKLYGPSPIELMKAQKNQIEIQAAERAQIQDGVAMTEFIYWLKHQAFSGEEKPTELSACDYLETCRRNRPALIDLSFETMAGYGINGASIHYDTFMGHPCPLEEKGFLLVDSGGQYMDGKEIAGTTDVTRTISLGTLTREEREHYTLVLRAYLGLSQAKFHETTPGSVLDDIPKSIIREAGEVYSYDTGHGVGHLLSVHEGPRMIGPTDQPMLPGMIVSNEPGIYVEGSHGIRIENELLTVEAEGCRSFRHFSWIPMDRAAILPELMSREEIHWLNAYHQEVYEKIGPYLEEPVRMWLKEETRPL